MVSRVRSSFKNRSVLYFLWCTFTYGADILGMW